MRHYMGVHNNSIFTKFSAVIRFLATPCAGVMGAYLSLPYKSIYVTVAFAGWATAGAIVVRRRTRRPSGVAEVPRVASMTQVAA